MYRESGAIAADLAKVNESDITKVDYQPLLGTSVTVTGALLASLGNCSIAGMSLGLTVTFTESDSQGKANPSCMTIISYTSALLSQKLRLHNYIN